MSAAYFLQRLLQTLLTVFFLSVVVFGLARLSGDPVSIMAPAEASPEVLAQMRSDLGLDRSLAVQFWRFVSAASVGDFGESVKWNQPAAGMVLERFPATLLLSASAMVFGLLLALPVGILSARLHGGWIDGLGKLIALVGQSMPTFWFGILLILVFAIYFPLLPTSGYGSFAHLVLPSVTLGSFVAASIMRVTRSAMLDCLQADYIRTARSKGLSEWRVVLVHALKNAAVPIVTITALQAANILRGAVVTETIFAWPGVGKIAVDAVYSRDFPLVQASVMLMGTVFLLANLAVDVLNAALNPRLRHGGGG
jgi:peptide/nickel transport system permease protein